MQEEEEEEGDGLQSEGRFLHQLLLLSPPYSVNPTLYPVALPTPGRFLDSLFLPWQGNDCLRWVGQLSLLVDQPFALLDSNSKPEESDRHAGAPNKPTDLTCTKTKCHISDLLSNVGLGNRAGEADSRIHL